MKFKLRSFNNKKEAFQYLKKIDNSAFFPSYTFWQRFAFLLISLRLIVPVFIFVQPLLVFILFSFLDQIDYGFLKILKISEEKYHTIEKPLDLFSQFFMMLYGLTTEFSLLFVFLFIYRLIGTILFILTKNRFFLIVFPNFIEVIFLSYLISFYFGLSFFLLSLVFTSLKIIQELHLHKSLFRFSSTIIEISTDKKLIPIQIS